MTTSSTCPGSSSPRECETLLWEGDAWLAMEDCFEEELAKRGPSTYRMAEKAYWEELMSFTVEQFSAGPPGAIEQRLKQVRKKRRWFELGKYFNARPDAEEATGYRMIDDAVQKWWSDTDAILLQVTAQQIDDDEMAALFGQASARFQAVVAIADASIYPAEDKPCSASATLWCLNNWRDAERPVSPMRESTTRACVSGRPMILPDSPEGPCTMVRTSMGVPCCPPARFRAVDMVLWIDR